VLAGVDRLDLHGHLHRRAHAQVDRIDLDERRAETDVEHVVAGATQAPAGVGVE
jgi:hypothetical protein